MVFDLDKTITTNDTYLSFLLAYLSRNPFRLLKCWQLPFAVILYKLKVKDNTWLKKRFLGAIVGGASRSDVNSFANRFVEKTVKHKLRGYALQEIEAHRNSGRMLILATASFDFYVEDLGQQLGFDVILCTNSVWDDDRLLGDISGENCYGVSKLHRVRQYLRENQNANYTLMYSDHHSDLPLMDWVDEAIAVNPTARLRELAEQNGYEIKIW